MLQVIDVHAGYGDIEILRGTTLEIAFNEIVCLIGSNGAGKSTLLKTLAGLVRVNRGSIMVDNRRVDNLSCFDNVKIGITLVPEGRKLFGGLSIEENLLMGAYLRNDRSKIAADLLWVYSLFPVLKNRRKQLAGTLSGGEQQMCAIGRGLMAGPKYLLIDELSLGLAPLVVDELAGVIKDINLTRDMSVLVVEQDLQVACDVSSRGYVMEMGTITMRDDSTTLLESPDIKNAYMGI